MSTDVLPTSIEAEAAVLGACLLDRDAVVLVSGVLEPADFYHPGHAAIYTAMLDLYKRRVPPDLITVSDALRQVGQYDDCGGSAYLMELAERTPTAYHCEYYARIVFDKWVARQFIEAGRGIAAAGYEGGGFEALSAHVQERMQRIANRASNSSFISMEQGIEDFMQQLGAGGPQRLRTGVATLDQGLDGGLWPDGLYTIAARPGIGKSWLGLQLAHTVASRGGRVVYFSYEMKVYQLMARMMALECGIPLGAINRPKLLTDAQLEQISRAAAEMAEWQIVWRDDFGLFLDALIGGAVGLQNQHGKVDLIVVDYLQLVSTGEKKRQPNRVQEVGEISRGLKRLAGTVACPVIALGQLNRQVEGRQGNEPQLSDLRESGDIEQDSDGVLLLWKKDDAPNVMYIKVAKHRHGPMGHTLQLFHRSDIGWFRDLSGYSSVEGY